MSESATVCGMQPKLNYGNQLGMKQKEQPSAPSAVVNAGPVVFREIMNLSIPPFSTAPEMIQRASCRMDSDNFITVLASNGLTSNGSSSNVLQSVGSKGDLSDGKSSASSSSSRKSSNRIKVFNMLTGRVVDEISIVSAQGAKMNPSALIIALQGNQLIQIFSIEKRCKLKSFHFASPITFWCWISETELAVVTREAVLHWSIADTMGELEGVSAGDGSPREIFERHYALGEDGAATVVNYQVSHDQNWMLLTGSYLAPSGESTGDGIMQLYCASQKTSQIISGYTADFTVLFSSGSNSGAASVRDSESVGITAAEGGGSSERERNRDRDSFSSASYFVDNRSSYGSVSTQGSKRNGARFAAGRRPSEGDPLSKSNAFNSDFPEKLGTAAGSSDENSGRFLARVPILCFLKRRGDSSVQFRLNICGLSTNKRELVSNQSFLRPIAPSVTLTLLDDPGQDDIISLKCSAKQGIGYILAKYGKVYVFDIVSGQVLLKTRMQGLNIPSSLGRNAQKRDIEGENYGVFTAVQDSFSEGLLLLSHSGMVYTISLNTDVCAVNLPVDESRDEVERESVHQQYSTVTTCYFVAYLLHQFGYAHPVCQSMLSRECFSASVLLGEGEQGTGLGLGLGEGDGHTDHEYGGFDSVDTNSAGASAGSGAQKEKGRIRGSAGIKSCSPKRNPNASNIHSVSGSGSAMYRDESYPPDVPGGDTPLSYADVAAAAAPAGTAPARGDLSSRAGRQAAERVVRQRGAVSAEGQREGGGSSEGMGEKIGEEQVERGGRARLAENGVERVMSAANREGYRQPVDEELEPGSAADDQGLYTSGEHPHLYAPSEERRVGRQEPSSGNTLSGAEEIAYMGKKSAENTTSSAKATVFGSFESSFPGTSPPGFVGESTYVDGSNTMEFSSKSRDFGSQDEVLLRALPPLTGGNSTFIRHDRGLSLDLLSEKIQSIEMRNSANYSADLGNSSPRSPYKHIPSLPTIAGSRSRSDDDIKVQNRSKTIDFGPIDQTFDDTQREGIESENGHFSPGKHHRSSKSDSEFEVVRPEAYGGDRMEQGDAEGLCFSGDGGFYSAGEIIESTGSSAAPSSAYSHVHHAYSQNSQTAQTTHATSTSNNSSITSPAFTTATGSTGATQNSLGSSNSSSSSSLTSDGKRKNRFMELRKTLSHQQMPNDTDITYADAAFGLNVEGRRDSQGDNGGKDSYGRSKDDEKVERRGEYMKEKGKRRGDQDKYEEEDGDDDSAMEYLDVSSLQHTTTSNSPNRVKLSYRQEVGIGDRERQEREQDLHKAGRSLPKSIPEWESKHGGGERKDTTSASVEKDLGSRSSFTLEELLEAKDLEIRVLQNQLRDLQGHYDEILDQAQLESWRIIDSQKEEIHALKERIEKYKSKEKVFEDHYLCCVCLENPRAVLYLTCQHCCVCVQCDASLIEQHEKFNPEMYPPLPPSTSHPMYQTQMQLRMQMPPLSSCPICNTLVKQRAEVIFP